MNPIDKFRAEMHRHGLDYGGPIVPDGRLHRFEAEGDGERNSWFVLHAGPPVAGAFGCWKRGTKETWCERGAKSMTDSEWRDVRAKWAEADDERKRAEAAEQERIRKTAPMFVKAGRPADPNHPYLVAKGVRPHGLRQYQWGAPANQVLVVPLVDESGGIHSVQFIDPAGTKRFLQGGRTAGCMALIGAGDGPIVLCEGWATGASIHEATGRPVVCAMNAGNLLPASHALRAKWPNREIIIAGDDDAWTAGNPGLTKATEAAKAIGAKLVLPQFDDTTTKPTDFNDLARLEGNDAVNKQINGATMPQESDDDVFGRLAKLSPADYDRCRREEAKRLGDIRTETLDREVQARRPKSSDTNAQGGTVTFPDQTPWGESVNGADLLTEICAMLRKHIIAPCEAIIACALYGLFTHAFDLGDVCPLLFVTGPTKRCGKSKLIAAMSRFTSKPMAVSSATPAGIYRSVEMFHPTLLIDETDAFLAGDEQLRGLINSGHTRDNAFHLGCVGDDHEPRRFSTWCPKVLSGIGSLADTIEDRSVIVRMRRRTKGEPVSRLRHRDRFEDLRRQCARFVADNADAIRNADPAIPEALNDRAADNWSVLFVLADLAGGDWPRLAREAAIELSGESEPLGMSGQLLADIAVVFHDGGADRMTSSDLCGKLAKIEGRPWAEFGRSQKPISANQLAGQVKKFGVSPGSIRIGEDTAKGYYLADFSDAFERYLPDNPSPKRHTVTRPVNIEQNGLFQSVTPNPCDGSEIGIGANNDAGCDGVTDQNGEETQEVLL